MIESRWDSLPPGSENPLHKSAASYPTGGLGYGLHCKGDARAWPDDTLKWLQKLGK